MQLSSRDLSLTTNLNLYNTFIFSVIVYGAESWNVLSTDASALRVLERKVLLKIFCPVRVGNDFHIHNTLQAANAPGTSCTHTLRAFERKVRRKIFSPARDNDNFHIRSSSELYELLNDMDSVKPINIQQMRNVDRIKEGGPAKRVPDARTCGSRSGGLRCSCWKDQIEESCHQLV